MPAKMAFNIVTDSSPAPNQLALSPDGTRLVAIISIPTRGFALWLRRLDETREQVLASTANLTIGSLLTES
jgi:hypothetical protein